MIFVDTGLLVALLDPEDDLRESALALSREWAGSAPAFATTDAVLIEFGNFFCRTHLRRDAIEYVGKLRVSRGWTIWPITPALLIRAERRYARHDDKHWSMTDCLSMEAMLERKVKDVATHDRHFAQAGFRVLMR